jgi:hypothetical protein
MAAIYGRVLRVLSFHAMCWGSFVFGVATGMILLVLGGVIGVFVADEGPTRLRSKVWR